MDGFIQNISAHGRADGIRRHQVHAPAGQAFEIMFQADEFEQSHRVIELHQHVNVAGGVASPRASEPNTASDFTPRWRKSAWWRLNKA